MSESNQINQESQEQYPGKIITKTDDFLGLHVLADDDYRTLLRAHEKFMRTCYNHYSKYLYIDVDDGRQSKLQRERHQQSHISLLKDQQDYDAVLMELLGKDEDGNFTGVDQYETPRFCHPNITLENNLLQDSRYIEYDQRLQNSYRNFFDASARTWIGRVASTLFSAYLAYYIGGASLMWTLWSIGIGFHVLSWVIMTPFPEALRLASARAKELVELPPVSYAIFEGPYSHIASESHLKEFLANKEKNS